jgi:hypothetical protein
MSRVLGVVPRPIGLREAIRICVHIRIKIEIQFTVINFIGTGQPSIEPLLKRMDNNSSARDEGERPAKVFPAKCVEDVCHCADAQDHDQAR